MKIGYPAKWRDYSALVIARDDLYGNDQRGYALEYDRDLAKLGGPVDRDEWGMTPQTVNAYYNPGRTRSSSRPRSCSRRSSTPRPTTRPTTAASGR